MKIYISEKLGSVYWLDEAQNLFYTPLMIKDDIYELSEDGNGGVVEWEVFAGGKTATGEDITGLVKNIENLLGGNKVTTILDIKDTMRVDE